MKLKAFLIKDTTGLPFQLFGVLYSNNCNALTAEKKWGSKQFLESIRLSSFSVKLQGAVL